MNPPTPRYGVPRSVLTRNKKNEYGLVIPSKNLEDYEPPLDNTANLWSSGTLGKSFNVTNNSKKKMAAAWNQYRKNRNAAKARGNTAKVNEPTLARALFGGRKKMKTRKVRK